MLYLIGLGIWDEKDLSLKGIEACRKAKEVYAELYTARWGGSLQNLEKLIGKKIRVLERKDMEEMSFQIIGRAKEKDIAVLVPGDPLSATTHINLLLDAGQDKVSAKVIHSSSVLTAVGEAGLSLYNFGRTVSVPAPQPNFKPSGFAQSILENRKMGLHTLILLDIGMGVAQGVEVLLGLEKSLKKKIISGQKIVACSGLGSEKQKIIYRSAGELLTSDLGPPAVLLIPGKLHFIEKEFLEGLI